MRKRKNKRIGPADRQPVELPERVNERWSMDFMSDVLSSGTLFRILNIVADFSRECPAIEVDTSLPGTQVSQGFGASHGGVRVVQGHRRQQRTRTDKQGTRRMGLLRAATLHRTGQVNLRKYRTKSMRLQRRAGHPPHRSFSRYELPNVRSVSAQEKVLIYLMVAF